MVKWGLGAKYRRNFFHPTVVFVSRSTSRRRSAKPKLISKALKLIKINLQAWLSLILQQFLHSFCFSNFGGVRISSLLFSSRVTRISLIFAFIGGFFLKFSSAITNNWNPTVVGWWNGDVGGKKLFLSFSNSESWFFSGILLSRRGLVISTCFIQDIGDSFKILSFYSYSQSEAGQQTVIQNFSAPSVYELGNRIWIFQSWSFTKTCL